MKQTPPHNSWGGRTRHITAFACNKYLPTGRAALSESFSTLRERVATSLGAVGRGSCGHTQKQGSIPRSPWRFFPPPALVLTPPPGLPDTKIDFFPSSVYLHERYRHGTQKATTASSRIRREETPTQLASLSLCQGEVLPLFTAVKIFFLVGRGMVLLEVARPPDFEISPSWGWPKKKCFIIIIF